MNKVIDQIMLELTAVRSELRIFPANQYDQALLLRKQSREALVSGVAAETGWEQQQAAYRQALARTAALAIRCLEEAQ